MPGVLVDDSPADHYLGLPSLPYSSPSHVSPLRHYIPSLSRSNIPDFFNDEPPPSQLSPLRPPAGLRLNVSSLSDMYAEDGNSLESLLLQLSPASAGQWGCNSASPTTISALSALQQFLPSNFEDDEGGNASQTDMFSCDEFRMYEFKVRRCMRGRSHDWTDCPFAHPGEKARRRDPRRFHYSGTACADFRKGSCKKGDVCEYAHGVFECWLHPARYRTQPCKDGRGCRRRICFFAHTPDQLRFVSTMSSPSALSSPTSVHYCPTEAFESCGSSPPICSPAKKASSESCKSRLTSSPLGRMAMEAPTDGSFTSNFSPTPPAMLSPSTSSSPSSPNAHINWSPRGVSTFALPSPAMPHLHPLLHCQASSAHRGQWERLNQALSLSTPQSQSQSKSALPLATSTTSNTATSTMRQVEDLMGLLKQADLTEEETNWRVAGSQPMSLFDGNSTTSLFDGSSTLWQGGCNVPEAAIKKGYSRANEEEMLIERFCNDEGEGEPKLERVESGKGLRAQIFQSLLRSTSQQGYGIYRDSNSEP